MTATVHGIMTDGGQMLPFARDLREALALYARRTWAQNTAKRAASAWGLDTTTAANLLKGHASDATLTKVFRAGGWQVAAAVMGAVIGHSYDAFLENELKDIADEKRRLDEAEREARARWARTLARRSSDAGGLRLVAEADRSWAPLDRRGPGDVGAEPTPTARRVK